MMERNVDTSENPRNRARRQLFVNENESEDERQNSYNQIMEDSLQQSEEVRNEWILFYIKSKKNRLLKLFIPFIKYKIYNISQ